MPLLKILEESSAPSASAAREPFHGPGLLDDPLPAVVCRHCVRSPQATSRAPRLLNWKKFKRCRDHGGSRGCGRQRARACSALLDSSALVVRNRVLRLLDRPWRSSRARSTHRRSPSSGTEPATLQPFVDAVNGVAAGRPTCGRKNGGARAHRRHMGKVQRERTRSSKPSISIANLWF